MATMSIRGLDDKVLVRLKKRAQREGSSVNSLVVRILEGRDAPAPPLPRLRPRRELDRLAGTWTDADAREFEQATAPFREIDQELWK